MHLVSLAVTLTTTAILVAPPAPGDPIDGTMAFERLKSLAGTWRGDASGEGEAQAGAATMEQTVHEFRVASAGTVVMETMGVGSSEEMINMYHLDGDSLMVTHYCSSGNQPSMRLDSEASTTDRLVFAFAGGTGFDPAVDNHIHGAVITFVGPDEIDSSWSARERGETVGVMRFHLRRDS
jgi:hypothetical protein